MIYRIGRKPNPWNPPDWSFAGEDRTFGHRFDDFEGMFRVLYAGSSRLGCFVETLANFRKPPHYLQPQIDQITDTPQYSAKVTLAGVVPGSWLCTRQIGSARLTAQRFANIYSSSWLAYLRTALRDSAELMHAGDEFDLSLLMSQRRRLTQYIARHIYNLGYDGIYYQSRHGTDLRNWALFEPFGLVDEQYADLDAEDPDSSRRFSTFRPNF